MDRKILSENDLKELEILEFVIAGNTYAISVNRIEEILSYRPVVPVPQALAYIEGTFICKDKMTMAVDLCNYLRKGKSKPEGLFIIIGFNKQNIAFHVESVRGIHRILWTDIKIGSATFTSEDDISIGVVNFQGKLITILDFDKIIEDIPADIFSLLN